MARRSMAGMMATAMILLAVSEQGGAQPLDEPMKAAFPSYAGGKITGILTGRLSGAQLQTWNSIEKIVFARDKSGRLLHPTLRGLWQQAEESGHAIHIEMSRRKEDPPQIAGVFFLEESHSCDDRPAGVIRLFLRSIDNATTCRGSWRDNRFVPFEKLRSRNLRYAEVLGHELMHALLILSDPKHARDYRELERAVADLALFRRVAKWDLGDEAARARMNRIRELSTEVERRAEAAEIDIWRELLGQSVSMLIEGR